MHGARTVGLIVATLLAVGCGSAPVEGVLDGGEATGGPVPQAKLYEEPVADDPDPARRAGAAAEFVVCAHGIRDGGWSGDFGPPDAAPGPTEALGAFVGEGVFALPRSGYVEAGRDDARRLFTYSTAGAARVAVIVADAGDPAVDAGDGWSVETFASCDPAEFDPSVDDEIGIDVWLDDEGRRVPIGTVRSAPGPEHCGWGSATFLTVADATYVRDPDGVLPADAVSDPFLGDTTLPADAADTGYTLESRRLWLAADAGTAYLVSSAGVEAWPSPVEPFGCA